jgi:hypothetical protein
MICVKTDEGQKAFKERSPLFSGRQRSAFILFDGVRSVEQVLAASSGLGVTRADIDQMVGSGFLRESGVTSPTADTVPAPLMAVATVPVRQQLPHQERYALAWPLATQLTASLGLRGFRLNLSVEAATGFDDLLALFPKIQAAVGVDKAAALEKVLRG